MPRFGVGKSSTLTLCIFPHLREFVVVDARPGLPGRPRLSTVRTDAVLDRDFYAGVEAEFGALLHQSTNPFLALMSISQEVEGLVRTHVLRAILSEVNSDLGQGASEMQGSVAVLFFTGPLLTMSGSEVARAARELFDEVLPPHLIEACVEQMCRLAGQEREAEAASSRTDLPGLIRGEGDRYVTLWESRERD